jgi:alkyl hydroperoxide reductase subunit F
MLDNSLKGQLQAYLARMTANITLVASLDDGALSAEMRGLLQDIAEQSPRIAVRFDGDNARKPSFEIIREGADHGIRFAGLPMGHEFTSLILALLQTGGVAPKIEPELIEQIKALPGEYNFTTYFSQSCQVCPEVVQAFNVLAVLNPNIHHTAIDGGAFQAEVEAEKILAVPTVKLNGAEFAAGAISIEQIIAKLDSGAEARIAETLGKKGVFDVLVVGGGPAGAAAAIYAARKGIVTGIVAERFGGQVQDTLAIENFISVSHTEGPKFAAALEAHTREYGVDIIKNQTAQHVVTPAAPGGLFEVQLASGASLKAKSLVVAPGARWRSMNVPGEAEYRTRGVAYCPHCDGPLFKGKPVAVIGGGNSGVEAAIDLAGITSHVTLIEFDNQLRADAVLQAKLNSLPNTTIIVSALTTEVHGDGEKVTGLSYKDRVTGEVHTLELAGIFVQIGLVPNSDFLKGTVALTPRGEIEINPRNETSQPGLFAAGDATTVPYKQIIIATGEGAKAALSAFDYLIRT